MMPLLNRGAIANFFGLADEEEYEEYPEASKPAVSQPTKPRVTQTQQPRTVSKQPEQQTKSIRPAKPEYVQANDTKKVIELHQSPNKKIIVIVVPSYRSNIFTSAKDCAVELSISIPLGVHRKISSPTRLMSPSNA